MLKHPLSVLFFISIALKVVCNIPLLGLSVLGQSRARQKGILYTTLNGITLTISFLQTYFHALSNFILDSKVVVTKVIKLRLDLSLLIYMIPKLSIIRFAIGHVIDNNTHWELYPRKVMNTERYGDSAVRDTLKENNQQMLHVGRLCLVLHSTVT